MLVRQCLYIEEPSWGAVLPVYESHYKDKTVVRQSYLYNGNPHTLKDYLYLETELWILVGPGRRQFRWHLQLKFTMLLFSSTVNQQTVPFHSGGDPIKVHVVIFLIKQINSLITANANSPIPFVKNTRHTHSWSVDHWRMLCDPMVTLHEVRTHCVRQGLVFLSIIQHIFQSRLAKVLTSHKLAFLHARDIDPLP